MALVARPAMVTFTGVDAWTDLDRLEAMSRRWPVEWGVLFSPERQGDDSRYPPFPVVDRLRSRGVPLAAHICGGWARELIKTGVVPELGPLLGPPFGRVQVNTTQRRLPLIRLCDAVQEYLGHTGQLVLQTRSADLFPEPRGVDWLYDLSGGRGELPSRWPVPEPESRLVGYAGGLGPSTIERALQKIGLRHPPSTPFWVDMETGVRTDDRLDLDKCLDVLRQIYGNEND